MAEIKKKKKPISTIDPVYKKFSRSIIRTLGSTEFYEFFMDSISRANNEFQFSNRRLEKLVDLSWIDAIEESLEGFQNIISNPRNIIKEEELIVNVANAKKAGADVVRHLAQHSSLVEHFDEETGDVRPSKLMQKFREDSTELYENRLVYTVLEHSYHFVQIRYNALMNAMNEEYGAKLKVTSDLDSTRELIHVDMFLHIKEKDDALETDEKHREVFDRISRMYRLLGSFMGSQFAEQMKKINRVKGNITKTNVLKKNPDYKKIVKLWEFMHQYDDVGYMIKVTEQNPYIDEAFQRDIFHNIMFQYIILKGYLENEEERELPKGAKNRRRKLKPKVVKEIIEELTQDYDLPDVEVRKVLIEELTREQALLEEKEERLRLVEEFERQRREEEERRRREEEEEKERILQEAAEKQKKQMQHKLEQELEDRRRSRIFITEMDRFAAHLLERMQQRIDEQDKWSARDLKNDFADAAKQIEEAEQRKMEEEERIRLRRKMEEERKLREEEERKERERKRMEERVARIKKEKEEAQISKDMTVVGIYLEEAQYFVQGLDGHRQERFEYEVSLRQALEQLKIERKIRQARREEESKETKALKWRVDIR